jgi:hypothetical protein
MASLNASTNVAPLGWGTTVPTVSTLVFPGVSTPSGVIFINPSSSVSIAICPANVNLGVNGVYTGFKLGVAVINGPGSVTLMPGDKWIVDNLLCTTPWYGIAGAAGGMLTVFTF